MNLPGTPRRRRRQSLGEMVAREEAAAKRRRWEDKLAMHIKAYGLPIPEREYRFDPVRLWRLDFAWPKWQLAAEVEGLTYDGGRHQRVKGYTADVEKYNAAAAAGIIVLRFTSMHVQTGRAIRQLEAAFRRLEAEGKGQA